MWRHVLFTEFMSLLENITWQLSSTSKILIDLLISTFTPWLIRHLTSEILAYKTFKFFFNFPFVCEVRYPYSGFFFHCMQATKSQQNYHLKIFLFLLYRHCRGDTSIISVLGSVETETFATFFPVLFYSRAILNSALLLCFCF